MTAHPLPAVQNVGEQVSDHMDAILRLFKPGAKITVLVRQPHDAEHKQGFVLTNDSLDDAILALEARKNPSNTLTGEV